LQGTVRRAVVAEAAPAEERAVRVVSRHWRCIRQHTSAYVSIHQHTYVAVVAEERAVRVVSRH
jgi:hypothetical protein